MVSFAFRHPAGSEMEASTSGGGGAGAEEERSAKELWDNIFSRTTACEVSSSVNRRGRVSAPSTVSKSIIESRMGNPVKESRLESLTICSAFKLTHT